MKKIILAVIVILMLGVACSEDSDNLGADKGDGTGGSLAIFALKGDYLYSVDNQDLNVFSLANDQHPVKVNDIQIGFAIETLFANGDFLYVGSQNGMFIYSLENPENPELLSAVQHITACDPVVANATHAFVTLRSTSTCGGSVNVLDIYDTADPTNPQLIHRQNIVNPKGLGLYNNYLFVCDDVIKIFNIDNPNNPVIVGSLPQNCFDVIIKDNVLFAIGEDSVLRYSLNPADISDIILESTVTF